MEAIVLPYGNAGWRERRRVLEDLLSSRPGAPFLFDDILVLVPHARMKRRYGRLFLDCGERKGTAALVPPEVLTLHQFFHALFARLGGPRLMDENTRIVLLEGIVKERLSGSAAFPLSPDLLAPSLSAALANMIEQLSGAGIGPDDLSSAIRGSNDAERPQVRLLLDVFERYEVSLRETGLVDPAGALAYLRDHFDPALLASRRMLLIDGIRDLGPLEAAVLKRAIEHTDSVWLIDAPSAAVLKSAGAFHPLRIMKDTLGAIGVVPRDAATGADPGQLYLASALFSDRSFSETAERAPDPASFGKNINLLSAVNTREEVTFLAGEIKKSLARGTPAESVLVAFPAIDDYAPLVEEIFTDYGIPYNRALGRQLGTSAVATAVVSLLRVLQEDFSGPSLLRVLDSPFLKFADDRALAPSLDRLLRRKRIIGGRNRLMSALTSFQLEETAAASLTGPLGDLFSALDRFSARVALPLNAWMKRLDDLIAWSELGMRVARVPGALNINLQAYKKLVETLGSLSRAGEHFSGYTYTFSEWLFLLKKTFMHTRFQVPPEDEGGIQVLGLEESTGTPWSEIYLGGLVDGAFPRRLPQNIFLPEKTLEGLGVRTLERARLAAVSHFYRLLLSADTVTLTLPENEGDRPVIPSSFLEELTPLKKAGLVNRGIEQTSGIQFGLKIDESRSIPELAKAISLSGDTGWLDGLSETEFPGLRGIKAALVPEPGASPVPAHRKDEFWVTELDAYLQCPYDYYVTNVLGLEPLEEASEDISPRERGSKVHAVLRNFYRSWSRPVTHATRDEAMSRLNKLAESAFAGEADTFRNRREKELFLSVMAGRFLDAEVEFWKQGFRPAYLEQKIERFPLTLSNGHQVRLSAKIDRIDVAENGDFIIVDYKTGKYPLPKMGIEQDIFQLPVYAIMAMQALSGHQPDLKNPAGLAYYDLAGKTGGAARDVVLFNKEARTGHPSSKPQASPKSADDFKTILSQGMDKARRAIEAILSGDFTSLPQDENTCRFCTNEIMCNKESSRE